MDLQTINDKLELYYGREIDGRPRYRTVWSTGITERRYGEFNEFYGSIFLRTTVGLKDVLKYPYDQDRWIVEKLFYIPNKEIVAEKPGSYEPFYMLKGSVGQYLPLSWKAIDLAVNFAEGRPVGIHLTDKDWNAQEQKEIDVETAYFEDRLADEGRSNLFAFENSVFVDSTRRF